MHPGYLVRSKISWEYTLGPLDMSVILDVSVNLNSPEMHNFSPREIAIIIAYKKKFAFDNDYVLLLTQDKKLGWTNVINVCAI